MYIRTRGAPTWVPSSCDTDEDHSGRDVVPSRSSVGQDARKHKTKCAFCIENHWIAHFSSFFDQPAHDSNDYLKTKHSTAAFKACFNCLKQHMVRFCKSKFSCKNVSRNIIPFFTLIHIDVSMNIVHAYVEKNEESVDDTVQLALTLLVVPQTTHVHFLQWARLLWE